jgi:AraC-like DNA-binding protein
MTGSAKIMIAGCIERMRREACGGCEREDACSKWAQAFGFAAPAGRRAATFEERPFASSPSPFLAFLGQVAKVVEARARPRSDAFRREVERKLEPMLASGDVRIDQVARELGYSRQTLYRRLKAEGATFAGLLDGLRRRLAIRLVRDEGLPVKEAAWRLGFSDPAAFSRAFKRWTGKSPSAMRRQPSLRA